MLNNNLKNGDLYKFENQIFRIIDTDFVLNKVFIIDCIKQTMPQWVSINMLNKYIPCTDEALYNQTSYRPQDINLLSQEDKKIAHQRYTIISPIIIFASDVQKRNELISKISETKNISKQTIRKYFCLFMSYQSISVLAPKHATKKLTLTNDEKNMRWALNKFFYNRKKNSLNNAYICMLKEKYCDSIGCLQSEYPSFYQFRYFYRKTKKMQNYYISRNGLSDYQRNNRPLLGDGVQEYSQSIGMGMLDSTICDIYLINESGDIVGRPILTACVDAYSGLCCGYSLTWEGGVYSLRNLMLNVISDKQEWCRQFGINISQNVWDAHQLPSVLVSDMGAEYTSENFEQITELGVTLINLPPYRPELKGTVEKFFDIIQGLYKVRLKGKGVVEPDFQERGAHDYRKDACLTITEFEKVIIRCIIYYNSERILEKFPYTQDMINNNVDPFSNTIWNYEKKLHPNNLIDVSKKDLIMSLLPRTTGKFSRIGLCVNRMRYKSKDVNYTEKYLSGGTVTVSYNPDDVSIVWVLDKGQYIPFYIIEKRYLNKTASEVSDIQKVYQEIINRVKPQNIQSKINLMSYIDTVVNTSQTHINEVDVKKIKETKKREKSKTHIDLALENEVYK